MIKVGDKSRIIHMDGKPKFGAKTGVVEVIDDIGQIRGSGGVCALIPGVDEHEVVED